ncbi:LysR family transcriptional regulator [Ostreiculturibacter nitratireducens]|uniref:LysR family transcriptional regulator n=1 Tax=Ostreiculturibacter nitratireducens TaxID=3075226 RepID=UPI0031B5F9F2
MHRDNWDDLRFVLAVAETGSVSGAARRLGVNHATVLRRIAGFEERAGVALFDKTARGYDVPTDKRRVVEAAREVAAAMQAVDRALRGAKAPLSGEVRVTSTDTFCQVILPPIVADLRREAPELRIEILCTNAHVDLARIQADIAVRPAVELPEDLVGESVARLGFRTYGATDGGADTWLGLSGPLSRSMPGRWIEANVQPRNITGKADSFVILREMVAAGLGIAILPAVLGEGDARLRARTDLAPDLSVPVWVASHVDLAGVPRLAQVRARIARALREQAGRLQGTV